MRDNTVWINDYLGVRGIGKRLAKAIAKASDMGGTVQAGDMLRLLPGADPRAHTTCSLIDALRWAGGEVIYSDD